MNVLNIEAEYVKLRGSYLTAYVNAALIDLGLTSDIESKALLYNRLHLVYNGNKIEYYLNLDGDGDTVFLDRICHERCIKHHMVW